MKISLYQIIPELDNDHLMFRDLQFIRTASDNRIPAEIYENVYHGELDVKTLEDIFAIFNLTRPEGYRGRSLSVSDVIEVSLQEGNKFYFCKPVGFEEVVFDKSRAMASIINHDFKAEEIIRCGNFKTLFCDEFGMKYVWCSKILFTRYRYSQCQLGYLLKFQLYADDCWRKKIFLSRPKILLIESGFKAVPDSIFHGNSEIIKGKLYSRGFDNEKFYAIEQWCKEQNIRYEYL